MKGCFKKFDSRAVVWKSRIPPLSVHFIQGFVSTDDCSSGSRVVSRYYMYLGLNSYCITRIQDVHQASCITLGRCRRGSYEQFGMTNFWPPFDDETIPTGPKAWQGMTDNRFRNVRLCPWLGKLRFWKHWNGQPKMVAYWKLPTRTRWWF